MASPSHLAHPPWATLVWSDATYIYASLPCVDAPPYTMKFPHTEAGLSKALALLRTIHETRPAPRANGTHAKVRRTVRGHLEPVYTEEQRSAALEVLKKLKII